MFISGLVSVTFRQLRPHDIVRLVSEAGLESIEWGGDIHVPHGDLKSAREVRQLTADAGLTVAAYGSYYRIGQEDLTFGSVLETAVELGAPLVRVWAGKKGSVEANGDYRQLIVSESRRIVELAAGAGVTVAYEFHGGTLTDTAASARYLLEAVAHPNLRTQWQPNDPPAVTERLAGLREVLPWLANIHVFQWETNPLGGTDKRPLAEGESAWREYLNLAATTRHDHGALLEFVHDDAPDAFLRDARTLKEWLRSYGSP